MSYLKPFGAISRYFELFGAIWSYWELFEDTWSYLDLFLLFLYFLLYLLFQFLLLFILLQLFLPFHFSYFSYIYLFSFISCQVCSWAFQKNITLRGQRHKKQRPSFSTMQTERCQTLLYLPKGPKFSKLRILRLAQLLSKNL